MYLCIYKNYFYYFFRYPNISVYKIRPEYEDHDFNLSLTVDKLEEIIRNPNDSRLLLKRRRTSPSGIVNFLADIEDMNLLIEVNIIY